MKRSKKRSKKDFESDRLEAFMDPITYDSTKWKYLHIENKSHLLPKRPPRYDFDSIDDADYADGIDDEVTNG